MACDSTSEHATCTEMPQESGEASIDESGETLIKRKMNIIMVEWSYVQSNIKDEVDRKFHTKAWALTLFSAIIAFSLNQNNVYILAITIPTIVAFWYIDVTRQGTLDVLLRRDDEISSLPQNPTDTAITNFQAPMFGPSLRKKPSTKIIGNSSVLARIRVLYFGSMIVGVVIIIIGITFLKR